MRMGLPSFRLSDGDTRMLDPEAITEWAAALRDERGTLLVPHAAVKYIRSGYEGLRASGKSGTLASSQTFDRHADTPIEREDWKSRASRSR